jgi:Zn-dependent protease
MMLFAYLQGGVDAGQLLAWFVAVALAITVHEYAHARRALAAGDTTPLAHGRVTLNPLAHYDPVGTTFFLLAGFGWAKPVPVNPGAFRNRRRDSLWVALWGPLSNVLLAAVLGVLLRLEVTGPYTQAVGLLVYANCVLAVFNLIPIAPLDGSHVLEALLPPKQSRNLQIFYAQYGQMVVMGAIIALFVPPFSYFTRMALFLPIQLLFALVTGRPSPWT